MKKALGIVRKMDELGRVVIPMEIRKQNGWKEGQPMEIFVDDEGSLILKAYGLADERKEILEQLDSLKKGVSPEELNRVLINTIQFIKDRG